MTKDQVTVVIVNWNGRDVLPDCLDGLQSQTYSNFRTIVVDNGSIDGSVEMMQQFYPEIEVIPLKKNYGFAVANNLVMEIAETKYVALLNNDTIPDSAWLLALVNAMENTPQLGMVASKMLLEYDNNTIDRVGDMYTTAGTAGLRGRGDHERQFLQRENVFGACAGAALYKNDMLKKIGYFDEDFFLLYEDVDLSFRAQLAGYQCQFIPTAIVYHKASHTIGNDSETSVYYSHRNLEWVYLKNLPTPLLIRSLWLHLVYDICSFLYFLTKKKGLVFFRAKRDAIRQIPQMLEKRKKIQIQKKVKNSYIWGLFEKESFLPRLKRRMNR